MAHELIKALNTLEAPSHKENQAAASSPLPSDAPPQDLHLVGYTALAEYNESEHFAEGLTIQHTLNKITNLLAHTHALGIDITEVKITLLKN